MPNADRVDVLQAFGFTPRPARFLVLVLEHSGVCLPRQYPGIRRDCARPAHPRIFREAGRGGFRTTDLAAPAHAGRIDHLQYKPWYRLLGEPDHRHRKAMSVGRAVAPSTCVHKAGRLMVLDGVIAEPEVTRFGLARDKVMAAGHAGIRLRRLGQPDCAEPAVLADHRGNSGTACRAPGRADRGDGLHTIASPATASG